MNRSVSLTESGGAPNRFSDGRHGAHDEQAAVAAVVTARSTHRAPRLLQHLLSVPPHTPHTMPAPSEREEKRGCDAGSAIVAYVLGAATVGAALLARMLQKKLRRRRRVVRAGLERPALLGSRAACCCL